MHFYWFFLLLIIPTSTIIKSNELAENDIIDERLQLLKTIQGEAETIIWASDSTLNNEQLHLLLNFTCVAYALSHAELKLQEEINFIAFMGSVIHQKQDEYAHHPEYITMLEKSLMRFKNLLKAKYILKASYLDLNQKIEGVEHKALYFIVQSMAHHASYLIRCMSSQEQTSIDTLLKNSLEKLNTMRINIARVAATLQACYDNNYPFASTENLTVQKISLIQALIPLIAENACTLMNTTKTIGEGIMPAQEFCALAFYVYYKVIYEGMRQRQIPEQFFTSLFDDNCIVSTDKKTHLLIQPVSDTNDALFIYK